MSATSIDEQRQAHSVRSRVARLGAVTAALALTLTGFTATSANALPLDAWVKEGSLGGNIQFSLAQGVAVDKAVGDVYVVDSTQNVMFKFNRNGALLKSTITSHPSGVAVDAQGSVYVVSSDDDRVRKYDKHGEFLLDWGASGAGNGQFSYPTGIAVNADGQVFVTDRDNHRVQKFDGSDGKYLDQWGGMGNADGKFSNPRAVGVNNLGKVYVVDQGNDRIQIFDADGTWQNTWGSSGTGKDQFDSPTGIAFDAIGQAYVTDYGNSRIVRYTTLLSPISEVNLETPRGISVDPLLRRVYTAQGAVGASMYRTATMAAFTAGPALTGTAGHAYKSMLQASGFPAVTGFTITAGQLPPGLKLTGSTISGVPTRAGSFAVTLRAENGVVGFPLPVKSYTITIAKAASKVSAKFSTRYPRVARTNIRASIKVSAPYTTGLSKAGKVRVYYGKKRVKTYTVRSASGYVKVTLPKFQKKGKTRVTLRYLGNGALKSAKRIIYVRVR